MKRPPRSTQSEHGHAGHARMPLPPAVLEVLHHAAQFTQYHEVQGPRTKNAVDLSCLPPHILVIDASLRPSKHPIPSRLQKKISRKRIRFSSLKPCYYHTTSDVIIEISFSRLLSRHHQLSSRSMTHRPASAVQQPLPAVPWGHVHPSYLQAISIYP